jgi:hypothetical protein
MNINLILIVATYVAYMTTKILYYIGRDYEGDFSAKLLVDLHMHQLTAVVVRLASQGETTRDARMIRVITWIFALLSLRLIIGITNNPGDFILMLSFLVGIELFHHI